MPLTAGARGHALCDESQKRYGEELGKEDEWKRVYDRGAG